MAALNAPLGTFGALSTSSCHHLLRRGRRAPLSTAGIRNLRSGTTTAALVFKPPHVRSAHKEMHFSELQSLARGSHGLKRVELDKETTHRGTGKAKLIFEDGHERYVELTDLPSSQKALKKALSANGDDANLPATPSQATQGAAEPCVYAPFAHPAECASSRTCVQAWLPAFCLRRLLRRWSWGRRRRTTLCSRPRVPWRS